MLSITDNGSGMNERHEVHVECHITRQEGLEIGWLECLTFL